MNILLIEPFFGGSHRAFSEGLSAYSSHHIDLLTLPDRNWNWRINSSAVYITKILMDMFKMGKTYDGLIISSMIRLSDLKALVGHSLPPVVVYFHESQLTYPLPSGKKPDRELVMSDITTALAADHVIFNSCFHRSAFLASMSEWFQTVPDYPFPWVVDEIASKSSVLHPGIDVKSQTCLRPWNREKALIIWNHRWSYDKNAPSFFYALDQMMNRGLSFDVALLGECAGWIPKEYNEVKSRLGKSLIQFGYLKNKNDYISFLESGSLAVSTAKQENFGISMVEAIHYGCLPLLPKRLSYQEILPKSYHDTFLYSNQKDFLEKLDRLIRNWKNMANIRKDLSSAMNRFSWTALIRYYDDVFTKVFY